MAIVECEECKGVGNIDGKDCHACCTAGEYEDCTEPIGERTSEKQTKETMKLKRNPLFSDEFIKWIDSLFESSGEDRITLDFYKDRSYIVTIRHDVKKYG